MPNNTADDNRTPLDPADYADAAELNRSLGVRTGRDVQLDALDHLRTWCENENAPAPEYVTATHTITRDDEVDETLRMLAVNAFADRHGAKPCLGRDYYHAYVVIYSGKGVYITYALMAERDAAQPL